MNRYQEQLTILDNLTVIFMLVMVAMFGLHKLHTPLCETLSPVHTTHTAHWDLGCGQPYKLWSRRDQSIGVYVNTTDPEITDGVRQAIGYWNTIVDLHFYLDHDIGSCSIFITGWHLVPNRLAQTMFPDAGYFNGVIWFNVDECLSADLWNGVIRHEIGHQLGLEHSFDRGSVMYPFQFDTFSNNLCTNDLLDLAEYHTVKMEALAEHFEWKVAYK